MLSRIALMHGAILASLLASSCLSLDRPNADKTYYVLDATRTGAPRASGPGGVLRLGPVRIAPAYDTREFVYARGESAYESDFYNAFFAPLETIVRGETGEWLGASGLFEHVLVESSVASEEWILEGAVRAAFGDFRDASASRAVLDVQFLLLASADRGARVAFQKDYRESAEIEGDGPDALVEAWNRALERILVRLEADLAPLPPPGDDGGRV